MGSGRRGYSRVAAAARPVAIIAPPTFLPNGRTHETPSTAPGLFARRPRRRRPPREGTAPAGPPHRRAGRRPPPRLDRQPRGAAVLRPGAGPRLRLQPRRGDPLLPPRRRT